MLSRAGVLGVKAVGCGLASTELPSELVGLPIFDPNGIPLSRGALPETPALSGSLCALKELPSWAPVGRGTLGGKAEEVIGDPSSPHPVGATADRLVIGCCAGCV